MDEYLLKWISKADGDLKVAEHEMAVVESERVTDAICFHCQQAIEKYLKAFLVFKNVDFGKTHNLEFLREKCAQIDSDFKTLDFGDISFYAVEVRYPDNFYIPSEEEANFSIKTAKKVRQFIVNKLS